MEISLYPDALSFVFVEDAGSQEAKANGPCYLTRNFILEKMPPIFQMLIGVGEHALSTNSPSKDEKGHYTILSDLNITRTGFLNVVSFLRLGFLSPEHIETALYTANILGGIPELDQYILEKNKQKQEALALQKELESRPPPTCPEEDTRQLFDWVTVTTEAYPMAEKERFTYAQKGWSATGGTVVISNNTFMYYRRNKT
jgi:hypothetical protein